MNRNEYKFLSNLISRIIKFYNEKRVIKTIKFMRYLFVSLPNEFSRDIEKVLQQISTIHIKLKEILINEEVVIINKLTKSTNRRCFYSDFETFFSICHEII